MDVREQRVFYTASDGSGAAEGKNLWQVGIDGLGERPVADIGVAQFDVDPTGRRIVCTDGWNGLGRPSDNLRFWRIPSPSTYSGEPSGGATECSPG